VLAVASVVFDLDPRAGVTSPWPPNLISSWSETGLVYTVDSLSVGVAVAGIRFQLLDQTIA
jgi:hypothetical protein